MAGSNQDELEVWLERMCARMRSDGLGVEAVFDDRMLGALIAVLVTVDGALCEIDIVRSRRRHAHVAVFAESEAAARRLASALDDAHRAVSRFANAERKLVHRIERVAAQLAHGWQARIGGYPHDGLARLQTSIRDARPMLGVGYHVDIAGDDADKSRHRYDPFCGASVPVGPRRRALIWHPQRQAFAAPTSTPPDGEAPQEASNDGNPVADVVLDATSEVCCALPDLGSLSCPDVSSLIPDCDSFDVPDCDCGGLDL